MPRVLSRLHVLLLRTFGSLPVHARRFVVRRLTPSFTVGAICVVQRDDGALLLVRQVYRSRWGLPGGLLQRGEAPEAAVVREVEEELGVVVELTGPPSVVVDPVVRRVDVVFRARLADDATPHPTSPEISDVAWRRPDDLPELQPEAVGAMVSLARVATGDLAGHLEALLGADHPARGRGTASA
jgi:8-oxo-dGTP pyrophosphatase MutT (NUDIX family)